MSKFLRIMEINCAHPINVEKLAEAIHEYWWKRSKDPKEGWDIGKKLDRPYKALDEGWKRDNRAAAVRIPEVLELAGLYLERNHDGKGSDVLVKRVIKHYLELLAEAEHDGWQEHRAKNGWTLGDRDDDRKRHPSMKPYRELDDSERKKDRDAVTAYPEILAKIGYRIAHTRKHEKQRGQ